MSLPTQEGAGCPVELGSGAGSGVGGEGQRLFYRPSIPQGRTMLGLRHSKALKGEGHNPISLLLKRFLTVV